MCDEYNCDIKDNQTMLSLNKSNLGFRPQKELIYNKLLSYMDELDTESQIWLTEIKGNLGRAVMLRELKPGCIYWSNMLNMWVTIILFFNV
jgi:proteasome activator subunit 4